MRRSWRRAMLRGIPLWARGYAVRKQLLKQLRRDRCVPKWKQALPSTFIRQTSLLNKDWVRKSVAATVTLAVLSGNGLYAYAGTVQTDVGNNISTTGKTETVLDINGNKTDIITGTIKGSNALNSFDKFNVAGNNFVNLIVPESATKLLNFIHGGQSKINGTLSSLLANGLVGGNVYLLNPSGVVVSAAGSINVGKLTMATPSAISMGLMENAALLSDESHNYDIDGALGAASYSNASIISNGKIVAEDLKLRSGGDVTLTNQVLVNVNVATGNAVSKDAAGNVEIIATNVNIGNSTSTTKLLASGDIKVEASKEAAIGNWGFGALKAEINVENAEIVGNSVTMQAKVTSAPPKSDDNEVIPDQAYLIKDGLTGDNEILSTVTSLLGSLTKGVGFTYVKGEANINVKNSTIKATGVGIDEAGDAIGNISLTATSTIESELEGEAGTGNIMGGYTSSQATINIADSTLEAKGDVKVKAEGKNTFKVSNKAAEEDGTEGATDEQAAAQEEFLKKIKAAKDAAGIEYEVPSADLTNETIGAMVGVSETKAAINITGVTNIVSGKNTEINAAATSELTVQNVMGGEQEAEDTAAPAATTTEATNKGGGFSVGTNALSATVAVGTTDAAVNIGSGVKVDSGKDAKLSATISAKSESSNSMTPKEAAEETEEQATTTAATEDPAESIIGLGVAFGQTKGTASVNTAAGSSVVAANDITISTEATKEIKVETEIEGEGKLLAASTAISLSDVKAITTVAGTVFAGNDLGVTAKVGVEGNELTSNSKITTAEAESSESPTGTTGSTGSTTTTGEETDTNANNVAGSSLMANVLKELEASDRFKGLAVEAEASSTSSTGTGSGTTTGTSETKPGLASGNSLNASVAVGIHTNTATVNITSTGSDKVSVVNNLTVNAEVEDSITNVATAFHEVEAAATTGTTSGTTTSTASTGKNAIAAAVIYSSSANNSEAVIGNGAIVNVGQDLEVSAKTSLPYKKSADVTTVEESLDTITTALGDMGGLNLDTVSGVVDASKDLKEAVTAIVDDPKQLVNSWAQSASESENVAGAVSVNVFELKNSSKATIGAGAQINQGEVTDGVAAGKGAVAVTAANEVTNVNFTGVIKIPGSDSVPSLDDFLGTKNAATGIGGSIQVTLYDNTAEATIGAGAAVKADDVVVTADNKMTSINMVVAGGSAKSVGVNGTLGYNQIDNTTRAFITDVTIQTAGNVIVGATDDTLNVNIGGGFAAGESVGIGVTVAVNNTSRVTEAGISGAVTAGGDITGMANNKGSLVAVTMAGSMTSDQKEAAETNATAENPTGATSTGTSSSTSSSTDSSSGLDVVDVLKSLIDNSSVNDDKKTENAEALENPTEVITTTKAKDSTYRDDTSSGKGYSLLADLKLTDGGTETKATDSTTGQTTTQEERTAKSGISVAGNVSVNLSEDKAAVQLGNTDATKTSTLTATNVSAEATNASSTIALSATLALATNGSASGASGTGSTATTGGTSGTSKDSYAIAGAFMMNKLAEETTATIMNTTANVTGNIKTIAKNDADIISVALSSAGASKGYGVAGQVSLNMINNDTTASIEDSVLVQTKDVSDDKDKVVSIVADDNANIVSVAGAVGYGSKAGIGASIGVNLMGNNTVAGLKNTSIAADNSSLDVKATEDSDIISVTAAVGVSTGKMAGAFAATGNAVNNDTIAYLDNESASTKTISTAKAVQVTGLDSSSVVSVAGGAAIATGTSTDGSATGGSTSTPTAGNDSTAIGAAAGVSVVDNLVSAFIGKNTKVSASSVALNSRGDLNITTIAAGGAGGGKNGVAGSTNINVLKQAVKSSIGTGATVTALGDVAVKAINNISVVSVAGALAIGGKNGVGGGADVEVISTSTEATIGNSAIVNAGDDVEVTAESKERVTSITVAAAGGGSKAVAGAADVNVGNTLTKATIGTGAKVTAADSIALTANDDSVYNLIGGSVAVSGFKAGESGSGTAAGGAVAVGVINKTIIAAIGDNAEVDALAKGDGVVANNGVLKTEFKPYEEGSAQSALAIEGDVSVNTTGETDDKVGISTDLLTKDRVTSAGQATVKGLSVSATSENSVRTVAAGAALDVSSQGNAIAGAVGVNVLNTTTEATIGAGAKINQQDQTNAGAEQDVVVGATGDFYHLAVAGGMAGSGGTAVGAGADVAVINNTTTAHIDSGAQVAAKDDVAVVADAKSLSAAVVAAGAASTSKSAVAASVNVNVMNNTVEAYIANSTGINRTTIAAGDVVTVKAANTSNTYTVAGGVAIGSQTSAGMAVNVGVLTSNTKAYIGDYAVVDGKGAGVAVVADTVNNAVTIAAGLGVSASASALAASVAVDVGNTTTEAYIGNNTKINTGTTGESSEQDVIVKATDTTTRIGAGATIAGSSQNAIGAGVLVEVLNNTTSAYIADGSEVEAKDDVQVTAETSKDVKGFTASVAASGSTGIAGSVSVFYMGAGSNSDGSQALQTAGGGTDVTAVGTELLDGLTGEVNDQLAEYENSRIKSQTVAENYGDTIQSKITPSASALQKGTSAYIGKANVTNGGEVEIKAADTMKLISATGGIAASGSNAVGGTVSVVVSDNAANAFIKDQAVVKAVKGININAIGTNDLLSMTIGGSIGGTTGVAGVLPITVLTERVTAGIGKSALVTAGDSVLINAKNDLDVVNVVGSLGIGGTTGVGLGISVEVLNTETKAYIGDDATVTAKDDIALTALSTEDMTSVVVGIGGGGTTSVVGSGNVHTMTTNTVAEIGKSAVTAEDTVVVNAVDDSSVNIAAGAVGGGGTAAVGGALGVNVISKNTQALIADGAQVTGLGKTTDLGEAADGLLAYTGTIGEVDYDSSAFTTTDKDGKKVNTLNTGTKSYNTTGEAKDEVTVTNSGSAKTASATTASNKSVVHGVAVAAGSANTIRTVAAAGGIGGTAGVQGSVATTVATATTVAKIGKAAKINEINTGAGATQDVLVAAGSTFTHLGVSGAVSGGGTAGIGAGADIGVITNTTKAVIEKSATVNAKDDVLVLAKAAQNVTSVAAAGAAGGTVGVAGSVGVTILNNAVEAIIGDDTVILAGDSVAVAAENTTSVITATGGAGIGGTVGVGMTVDANVIINNTTAKIGKRGVVDAYGSGVSVTAKTVDKGINVAAGLGIGGTAGIAGSINLDISSGTTEAYIDTNAEINQGAGQAAASANQALKVEATNQVDRLGIGATLAAGGTAAAGAGVLVENMNHTTSAYIADGTVATVKGDVTVNAETHKDIQGYTASLAVGSTGAIAGSVGVFNLGTSNNNDDAKKALSDAGGDNGTILTAMGDVVDGVMADTNKNIKDSNFSTGSEAGQSTGKIGEASYGNHLQSAANPSNSDLKHGTSAYIGDATVTSGRDVTVTATDELDMTVVTGAIAVDGVASVGGSVSVIISQNAANAFVDQGAMVTASRHVNVGANGDIDILNVAIGGGVSGYAGIGVVAPVTIVNESVTAGIGNKDDSGTGVTKVTAGSGSITVAAANTFKLSNNIGSLGVAISGVGAGIGVNTAVLSTDTTAFIDKNAMTAAGDDIVVKADSIEEANTIVVGMAGGLIGGVVGSGNVQIMNTDTKAQLGGTATAGDSILVEADDDSSIESYMVSLAVGGVGVGGAIDVEVIDKKVSATITDGANLQANANGSGVLAKTGEFVQNGSFIGKTDYRDVGAGKGDYNKNTDGTYSHVAKGQGNYSLVEAGTTSSYTTATDSTDEKGQTAGNNNVVSDMDAKLMQASSGAAHGVAVTATTRNDIRNIEAGASIGGEAVTGSAAVNVISNTTTAAVGNNVKINENNTAANDAQGVNVLAGTDMKYTGVAGAVSGGMDTGIGASGNVAVINNTTAATVGTATLAKAKKAVSVFASSSQTLQEVAATAGIGLNTGLAGSVVVNNLTNTTTASTGAGSRLVSETDSVSVKAENETTHRNIAGSLGVGGTVGGGLAVTVNNVNQTTTASLDGDATAQQNVNVEATNTEDFIVSNVGIGVGSVAGVAASVAVNVSKATTTAAIGNGTIVADNGAITVKALNDIKRTTVSMSLGGGLGLGAAAGVDVGVFTADTTASIGSGAVTAIGADGGVNVHAENKQDVASYTGSVGLGAVGLGGSVAVYSFGTSADGAEGATNDYVGQANTGTSSFVSKATGDNSGIGSYLSTEDKNKLNGFAVSTTVSTPSTGTTAKITSATINTKTLDVKAIDTIDFDGITAAAGGGLAGLGAAVSVVTADNDATAFVTGGSLKVADKLTVASSLSPNINLKTIAGAGGLGLALAGSGVVINEAGNSNAYIDSVINLEAGSVQVSAESDKTAETKVIGASASLGLSAAGSVSEITISGTTDASLGSSSTATVEVGGTIDIEADSQVKASSDVKAPAIGAFAAGLAVNTITANTTTNAGVADNSAIQEAQVINLKANATPVLSAQSDGKAYGLGALGLSTANLIDKTTVSAGIGTNTNIGQKAGASVGTVTVEAKKSQPTAGYNDYTYVNAGAGGLVGGSVAESSITKVDHTTATIGKGAKIKANTVTLTALHDDSFNHAMDTTGAGLVGASGGIVKNTITSTVQTIIDENAVLDLGVLDVDALNKTTKAWLNNGYNVEAGSGGALAGSAVVSTTTIDHDTDAKVNAGVTITASTLTADSAVTIDAASNIIAKEKNKLSAGGAIAIAVVETNVTATTSTDVTTDRAVIETAHGDIRLGARNIADLDSENTVDAYGLAGAPAGSADAKYVGSTNINTIDSDLTANDGDIQLLAGKNTSGEKTALKAYASVELWNKSAIPINTDPDPYASIQNDAALVVGAGSNIKGVRDIYLTATSGENSAKYYGVGKDPYREAASAVLSPISEAFGGEGVSFNITGGKAEKAGIGTVTINGNVETGIKRHQELTLNFDDSETINEDGNVESGKIKLSSTATEAFAGKYDLTLAGVASTMMNRYNELLKLKADAAGDNTAVAAYQAEIEYLQGKMVEMGIASWTGSGSTKTFSPGTATNVNEYDLAVAKKAEAEASLTKLAQAGTLADTLTAAVQAVINRDTAASNLQGAQATKAALIVQQSKIQSVIDANNTYNNSKTEANLTSLNNAKSTYTNLYGSVDWAQLSTLKSNVDNGISTTVNNITNYGNQLADAKTAVNSYYKSDSITITAAKDYEMTAAVSGSTLTMSYNQVGSSLMANSAVQIAALNNTIAEIDSKIAYSDLANADSSNELYLSKKPISLLANYITITDDVTADRGSVFIQADNVTGSADGKLNAPGDASITITNNTPAFLTIAGNLTISDGGFVYMNGASVNNVKDIKALNKNQALAVNLVDSHIITKKTTGAKEPTITIKTTFNPTLYQENSAGITHSKYLTPDIYLNSYLYNPDGKVTVNNLKGSIYLNENATITSASAEIVANNGDYVQSYNPGYTNIDGTPTIETAGADCGNYNTKQGTGNGILANGNILISAKYLNINGTIQSGIAEWKLDIPSDTSTLRDATTGKTLAALQAEYDSGNGSQTGLYQLAEYSGTEKIVSDNVVIDGGYLFYDAKNKSFYVSGIEVRGGSIDLYGQIMNTNATNKSAAQLKALAGYGTINITNNSDYGIVIGDLDTGLGAEGKITINDFTDNVQKTTQYISDGTNITAKTTIYSYDANGNKTTGTTNTSLITGNTSSYKPAEDLTYAFTTGLDYTQVEYYVYEKKDIIGIKISDSNMPGDKYRTDVGEKKALSNGTYLLTKDMGDTYYTNWLQSISLTSPAFNKISEWTKRYWWSLGIAGKYHLEYTKTTGKKDITTNYVDASNPIGISFFGSSTGAVDVTNKAGSDVTLSGTINNAVGTTNISNTKGSILQGSDTGLLITNNLNFTAQSLGTDANALRVMAGGTVNATATNGNINLDQVRGDLKVGAIRATKNAATATVNLTANGSIVNAGKDSLINADRINLVATNGTIGTADSALFVNTGGNSSTGLNANYGLDAKAYGNINIEKTNGDLLIDQVVSTTGDVRIKAGGALVDNEVEQQIDERSWAELTAFWDSLQLRDTAGNTRVADAEETFALNKNLQYMQYWTLKTQMEDGVYKASADEIAALNSIGSSVTEYEAARTERYNSLVKEGVNTWTDSYDQTWGYTLAEADKKNIADGAYWTDSQLSVAISPGVLKDLTDTNYIIKSPNVSGKNVTLLSSSIGSTTNLDPINLSKLKPEDLTTAQKVALAAAERNDFSFSKNADGDVLVTVNQKNPINVGLGTGSLTAIANNYVYLASEGDLLINRVDTTALRDDNNTTAGEIRIKAAGSITGVAEGLITLADGVAITDGNNRYHIGGTDVVLESSTGKIGGGTEAASDEDERIILDNDGALVARSEEDTYLAHKRKMYIDNLYSRSNIDLTAANGVELAHTASASVMSESLNMSVSGTGPLSAGETRNGIGTADQAIGIIVGSGGLNASTAGTGGTDEEDAGIYLKGGEDDLRVNQVNAGSGEIVVNTEGSIISNNTPAPKVQMQSMMMAKSPSTYDFEGDRLVINSENVGTTDTAVTSNVNSMNITASEVANIHNYKDVAIEQVSADMIKLEVDGSIKNAPTDALGFTGHEITLLANGVASDIGASGSYMKINAVDKSGVEGIAKVVAGRNVYIHSNNNIGSGAGFIANNGDLNIETAFDIHTDLISAASGAINITTTGFLTAQDVHANNDVNLTATNDLTITGEMTSSQGNITAMSTVGDVVVEKAMATTGTISLISTVGDLTATDLEAKGNIDLTAGHDFALANNMTSDEGNITVTAQRNIVIERAETGDGDITVTATAGNVVLRTLKAVGNTIQVTAGASITDSSSNDEVNLQAEDIDLKAVTGSIGTETNALTLQSTGKVDLDARQGSNIVGVGDLTIGKVVAETSDIIIKLKADSANPGQSLDLTINEAETATGMTLRADNITIKDLQQNNADVDPMKLDFSGATQPMANHVAVNLTSEQGVVVDKLKTNTAQIKAATDDIWFTDALVGERMDLSTNQVKVLDARRHTSIADADILLNTEGEEFDFSLVAKNMVGVENLVHKSSKITYDEGFNTLNIGIDTVSYQMAKEQERQVLAHEGSLVGEENGKDGQAIVFRGLTQGNLVDVTKLVDEKSDSEEKTAVDGDKDNTKGLE